VESMIYRATINAYVPEGWGFIDDGWNYTSMCFEKHPTRHEIDQWVRMTEISMHNNLRVARIERPKNKFMYITKNTREVKG